MSLDADRATVRRAFRDAVRASHPDTAFSEGPEVAMLVEARRSLLDRSPAGRPSPPASDRPVEAAHPAGPVDGRVDGDSLMVDADPATVMLALVDAGHALGEVTYLDRSSGLIEIMVLLRTEDAIDLPFACSLVASLQGRADGVEVFCTVERLDGGTRPPVAPLVAALAGAMGLGAPTR